jgi:hypothetical protein
VLLFRVISRAGNGPKKGLNGVLLQINSINLSLISLQEERELDMAKKSDAREPENQEKKPVAEVEKKAEKEEKSWLWRMIRENAQDFFILVSIILGIRQAPKQGETLPSGKEVPGWILSAFPSFTDEDEIEYNLVRDSHTDPSARKTEACFCDNLKADSGGYDEVKYRVRLVKLRREYLQQLRSPAPEDKSGGRLSFTRITLKDSAIEFISELIEESSVAGTPEEIYQRQKKVALDRKLLERKHFFKKCWENKLITLTVLLSIIACVPCVLYWIACLILN